MKNSSMTTNNGNRAVKMTSGDAVWLNAMRNSPVSKTPIYQHTEQKLQGSLRGMQTAMAAG
jgi:hypothetical protein